MSRLGTVRRNPVGRKQPQGQLSPLSEAHRRDAHRQDSQAHGYAQAYEGTTMMDRPRFDALLEGIASGNWDAELKELTNAINERQRVRREAVKAQVHEVFGPNHEIVAKRTGFGQSGLAVGKDRP